MISKPTRVLALLAAAGLLASSAVMAQGKPAASPVNKKMTREELRACMKIKDEQAALNAQVDTERKELDAQKAQLATDAETLKSMKAQIDAKSGDVKTLQTEWAAHQAAITDWNQRAEELSKNKPRNYDRLRFRLDDELRELRQKQAALEKQREGLMSGYDALVKDYNARAASNGEKVQAWNARNAAAAKASDRVFDLKADYQADCANRPFNESDEKAIKQGK